MIKSFIFTGIVCAFAQVIKDNTKLTNGHITSLFVVIGAFLGFLGWYDKIIEKIGGGAIVIITSFGNTLYKAAIEKGILYMLESVSLGIVASILTAFIITLLFKAKD